MTFNEQLTDWMIRLAEFETPPDDIIAFNFGLFETESGYSIYLIGSKTFASDNDDWATEVDYEPADKYLQINPEETDGLDWTQIIEKTKDAIGIFVASSHFKTSILQNANAITTGDGDLTRIK